MDSIVCEFYWRVDWTATFAFRDNLDEVLLKFLSFLTRVQRNWLKILFIEKTPNPVDFFFILKTSDELISTWGMKYLETSFCSECWPRSGKCGKFFFFHHTKAFSDPFRIIYTFALMSVRNLRWKQLLYWGSAVAEAYVEFSGRLMLEISWRLWS